MANMLAERIKSVKLTKTQKKIAEYFVQNQDRIGSLSSLDVAHEIGVSDASIIRFSRVIGYDGFADLKSHIYDSLVENANNRVTLTERLFQNKEKYGSTEDSLNFIEVMQQNIASVFRDNRPEDFERVVDHVVKARKRYVIGLRGCKGIALQFGRLLSFMAPGVHTILDSECTSVNLMQDIKKNDVVVMFVYSRFYRMDEQYLKMARKRGAKICLIVNDITGPLNVYADEVLVVASANLSFFHSTIALDLLSEYLLDQISERLEYKERLLERDEVTEHQRL